MKSCLYWFFDIPSLDSSQIYIVQIRHKRFVDRKHLCRWKENAGQSFGNPTVNKRDPGTSYSLSWNQSTKLWDLLYIFPYLQDWLAGLRFKLKWNIRHRLIVLHFNGLKKSMHNDRLRLGEHWSSLESRQTQGKKFPYLFSQCQPIYARALAPLQGKPSSCQVRSHQPQQCISSRYTIRENCADCIFQGRAYLIWRYIRLMRRVWPLCSLCFCLQFAFHLL